MQKNEVVYLAITNDIYELPIGIFETPKELAEFAGTSYNNACTMVKRNALNRKCKCRFVKVDIGKVEEEEK